jgi:hypothetical protein
MGLTELLKSLPPLPVSGKQTPMRVVPSATLDPTQIDDRRSGLNLASDLTRQLQSSAFQEFFTTLPPQHWPYGQETPATKPVHFPKDSSLAMLQNLARIVGKGPGRQLPGPPMTPGGPRTPYSGPTSFQPLPAGRYPVIDRTPNPGYDPSQVTPEIQHAALELWARFPGLTNMGTHNVRNVAGTNTPSEHSYGNAIDIGGTGRTLAEVASWAVAHAAKLGISQVIYQTSIWTTGQGWHPYTGVPHTTHVHLSGPLTYSNTNPNYPTVNFSAPSTRRQTGGSRTTPRVSRTESNVRRGRQV